METSSSVGAGTTAGVGAGGGEDIYHSLEQRHLTLLKEHQSVTIENQSLQGKITQLQSIIDELKGGSDDSKREFELAAADNKQKEYVIKELERANEELRNRNARLSDESLRLREDMKASSGELLASQERVHEYMNKYSEAEEKSLPLQYEVTKLNRERDLLLEQTKWLEGELEAKSADMLKLRRELNQKVNDLEAKVVDLEGHDTAQAETIRSLQERIQSKDEKLDVYLAKVTALEASSATEKATFLSEMESQRKLVDLYKRYFEEATQTIEELEGNLKASKEAHANVVTQLNAKLKAQQEHFDSVAVNLREEATLTINQLEEKLKQQEEVHRGAATAGQASADFDAAALKEGLAILNVTEIYDKVVEAQRELNIERSKRREAELYLSRIYKDVESKTPAIISQRREFNRLVETHSQLTQQLDEAVVELTKVKSALNAESAKSRTAEREAALMRQQNTDLSAQVQHLLRRMMEQNYGGQQQRVALIGYDENNASDVISDRLVTFDDIAELQSRNMQLLQVVRKLSEEQERSAESADLGGSSPELQSALEQAVQELARMREARQRTEEMVGGLVQQRDMYRAMVEEGDATMISTTTGAGTAGETRPSLGGVTTTPGRSTSSSRELEVRVARLEEELKRSVDRCARMEEAERLASEALDKARADSLALRLEAAHASSDASFQKERCEKLEEALKSARAELEMTGSKRSELQALLGAFQQEARRKDEALQVKGDELRGAHEGLRRLQVDVEVTKKSEERLVRQLAELKEDFKKQASVGDSIRKIEQGLLGQKENELLNLIRERDSLAKTVEGLRKELSDNAILNEQRQSAAETEARALRSRLESKTEECSGLREDLARESGALVSARDRSALLEKQLNRAHEQLSSTQGASVLSAATSSQAAQNEVALEKALADIESLTGQLKAAEEHAEQFKRISAANEDLSSKLRERFRMSKAAMDEEKAKLEGELEAARREAAERRSESLVSLQEAEQARNELQEYVKSQADAARSQSEALVLAQDKVVAMTQQAEALKMDVTKYQEIAREAQDNYRREVTMHSKTSEELFLVQKQVEESRAEVAQAALRTTELSAQVFRLESGVEEERRAHASVVKEFQSKLGDLQTTNNLLHSQLSALSAQINRFQENRAILAETAGQQQQQGGTLSESEEVTSLRTTASELREVVRYMKREQDVLEAKLSISDSENARLKVNLASMQKALDEAKAELSKELEHRVVSHREEDFARLLAEVNQLSVVRESNSHLRAENEDLVKKLARVTSDLTAAREDSVPLNDRLRAVTAEKTALESERESLVTDVAYWKDRLHQLVSRYNEVDPEEHRLLKSRHEEITNKVTALETDLSAVNKEVEALRVKESELTAELESTKRLLDNEQQTTEKLRKAMRSHSTRISDMQATIAQHQKTIQDLTGQIATRSANLAEAVAAVAAAEAAKIAAEQALAEYMARKPAKPVVADNSHGGAAVDNHAAGASATSEVPCRYFLQGTCSHGANCRYKHDPSAIPQPLPAHVAETTAVSHVLTTVTTAPPTESRKRKEIDRTEDIEEATAQSESVSAVGQIESAGASSATAAEDRLAEMRSKLLEKHMKKDIVEVQAVASSTTATASDSAIVVESVNVVAAAATGPFTTELESRLPMIQPDQQLDAATEVVSEPPSNAQATKPMSPAPEPSTEEAQTEAEAASNLNASAPAFVPSGVVKPITASTKVMEQLRQNRLQRFQQPPPVSEEGAVPAKPSVASRKRKNASAKTPSAVESSAQAEVSEGAGDEKQPRHKAMKMEDSEATARESLDQDAEIVTSLLSPDLEEGEEES